MTYVVDASVALKWLIPEPLSERAASLLDPSYALLAPDMLVVEAANVLWRKTLRRELSGAEAALALSTLGGSGVELRPSAPLAARALSLASALEHPVYDCVYLTLAERERVPLVSADARFLRAVAKRRLKIDVLPLADVT